jgi:hypothetical protein
MDTKFAERPHFFEGQYLGADDLETFLTYAREQQARHHLGSHTWGIIAGIELVQTSSSGGDLEYYLTPGVAVDGYGRFIVVAAPYQLTTDLFAKQLTTGMAEVWIRHDETQTGAVRAGFETCDCNNPYARIAEAFVVETGPRTTEDVRESGVMVGEDSYDDSRDALGAYLADQPIACDGSVAAQSFPGAEDLDRWLIPVGMVSWTTGNPGSFAAADEAAQMVSRIFRRHAGLVTEDIYPAGGVIRLRPRSCDRQSGLTNDQICGDEALTSDALVTCDNKPEFREMIWHEGHTRFKGDARLYGTRVEFQESAGTDYLKNGVPLAIRRAPDKSDVDGIDLQILLGERQGNDGPTRLTVGKATVKQGGDPCDVDFDVEPGVFIQEDAKLGIGTSGTELTLPLTIRGTGSVGDLFGLEAADGSLAWQMNFGSKGGLNFTQTDPAKTNLFLEAGGNVGIGTDDPDAKLDIRGVVATSSGSSLGAGKWFQVGDGDDLGRVWIQYSPDLAPLLVLSDKDDPPRIQFQQIGSGQETSPDHWSWIGHGSGSSPDIAVMNARLGVGTGTPAEALEVRGNVKLGTNGEYYGVGCLDNVRVIAGCVGDDGSVLGTHTGFTISKSTTRDGDYTIKYDTTFSETPVVVATLVDAVDDDDVLTVANSSSSGFDIHITDAEDQSFEDNAFNFIVLGRRA